MYDYEQKLKIQIHFIDVVQLKVDYLDVIYVSMWSRPPTIAAPLMTSFWKNVTSESKKNLKNEISVVDLV